MRAEWMDLTASLHLAERVSFMGWMSQQRCAEQLQTATALVLPSVYECGGAVVLEAMATGSPVIATSWGGPEDYIDESCGILIPPTSVEAMVLGFRAAMQRLIDEPQLRCKLGMAARKKIEAGFDWEDKVDRMLTIYQSSLDRTAP